MSIITAMAASFAALNLAARVSLPGARTRGWLIAGACAMGSGVWSMHFIGMLAFSLPVRVVYDPFWTVASLLLAIAASGVALSVVGQLAKLGDDEFDIPVLIAGAIIMGAGISAMHYSGMAAMKMSPAIGYRPLLFAASMLVAVTASAAALALAYLLRSNSRNHVFMVRGVAAGVMGLAIAGMHYTAMEASIFAPGAVCTASSGFLGSTAMGYGLALLTLLFVCLSVFAARYRSDHI